LEKVSEVTGELLASFLTEAALALLILGKCHAFISSHLRREIDHSQRSENLSEFYLQKIFIENIPRNTLRKIFGRSSFDGEKNFIFYYTQKKIMEAK